MSNLYTHKSYFGVYDDNGNKHTHVQRLNWVHNQFVMTVYTRFIFLHDTINTYINTV